MQHSKSLTGALILAFFCSGGSVHAQDKLDAARIKAIVTKSLPLLQKGAAGHVAQRTCFSCHQQALPVLALTLARGRGFEIDEDGFKEQLTHTHNVIAAWAKRNPDRKSFGGGQVDTAAHALPTLELGAWKSDEITAAVAEYLLLRDKDHGYWRAVSNRPPSEASSFTTTALAMRGLSIFGTPEQKVRAEERTVKARDWLLRTPAKDTEDRVFRLWGLKYAQAKPDDVQAAARELLKTQQKDGGWAQIDKRPCDAYATGSALTALHLAGGLSVTDPDYQRGLAFLVSDQKPDGSWLVKSRSKPFQTYFESGFPHGKDQWISSSASSWATAALVLACPPIKK